MFYTYVLKSKNKKFIYIGSTRDLINRFKEHNSGKVQSTKPYMPFELVYYEAYKTYRLARKREIKLKNHGQEKEQLIHRLEINNGEVAERSKAAHC